MVIIDLEAWFASDCCLDGLSHPPIGREQGYADGLLVGAHGRLMAEALKLRNAQPLLKSRRRCRSADLRAIDHEDVTVATVLLPLSRQLSEAVERRRVISGRHFLAHPLQAGIGEAGGIRFDQRKFVIVPPDDRNIMIAAQREEGLIAETLVARLDDMAQRY